MDNVPLDRPIALQANSPRFALLETGVQHMLTKRPYLPVTVPVPVPERRPADAAAASVSQRVLFIIINTPNGLV